MIGRAACALAVTGCLSRPTGPQHGSDAMTDSNTGSDVQPRRNIVFVTAGVFGPPWDSSAAAQFCGGSAHQAGLLGNYVAWLSYNAGSTDVATTLRALPMARDWYRPDGVLFAHTVDEIITLPHAVPAVLDENGADVTIAEPTVEVATGTTTGGTYDAGTAADCPAGNIQIGYPGHVDGSWTEGGQVPCNTSKNLRLYCFGFGA